MPPNAAVEAVWGDHATGRILRTLLAPAEWAFRAAVAARNVAYDRGVAPTHASELPAVSIGNVTVGGTGKTPVAAWVAAHLRASGASPAVVLRGYGGDEADVHAVLNPAIPVIVNPDRVAATRDARSRGCDVAVLDDAFQHRRAHRDLDVVLVSADVPWPTHCLPAGPLREPWSAMRRADLVVVTRKAAPVEVARDRAERARRAGATTIVQASLALGPLRSVTAGDAAPIDLVSMGDRRLLAIAGVANPGAFFDQLHAAGARVVGAPFPDHHTFSDADVKDLIRRAGHADLVVCTLKDAVKLRQHWPRSGPTLWYVSQRLELADGEEVMAGALRRVLAARSMR
ncbi:MAG: tetraacyldisaccharide 4'-kinase [Gemmatimonadaceae bacterium]|nr:tetraacyldisaccharide 4'-kinase [Gemmatimonadaceae bacterium]